MNQKRTAENFYDTALPADTDFASLLLEELRTAEELSQRMECLENARLRRRSVRPPADTLQVDLVRRVRKQIASGTYLSDARIDAAIGEMFAAGVLAPKPHGSHKAVG